ncbi:hypothetical protein [Rubrivirga sp. IMCC43871]|uniref:hypothetical protein n=1 Tax=Rubrivirga sp. IMCC43871 TaxID=3391575 RepID=UPI0039901EF1
MALVVHHVLLRFELYLAGATLVLFGAVTALVLVGAPPMLTGGLACASLLTLQIAIQSVDRERQRRLRAKAIHDIREMLQDRVLNQLAAIKMCALSTAGDPRLTAIVDDVDRTIDEVAEMVSGLSEEQLNTWQLRYANSDAHRFTLEVGVA